MADATVVNPTSDSKSQPAQPHGFLGRLIGWLMGLLNRKLNQISVTHMNLTASDRVLEIGCGAGLAMRQILDETPCRHVAGIDPSPEMIEESMQRNRTPLQAGRLELKLGKVENLPWPANHFTRTFAISNFHIWESRRAGLQEIFRVLRPGGKLILCLRRARDKPRWFDQPSVTEQEVAEDLQLIRETGFQTIEQLEIPKRQPILLLVASKPLEIVS